MKAHKILSAILATVGIAMVGYAVATLLPHRPVIAFIAVLAVFTMAKAHLDAME